MSEAQTDARRMLVVLAVGVTFGYLASSCAREGSHAPSPHLSAHGTSQPAAADEWSSLVDPESEEARASVTALCDRIRSAVLAAEGDSAFLAPEDLADCATAVFTATLLGDPSPLLEDLASRGAKPDHANLVGVADEFAGWQLIEPLDLTELSPDEAYRAVWGTRRARSMAILEVRSDWVSVGRGMVVNVGVDEWDYIGVRACRSSVVPASGRPSREQGEAANGTDASAHVCIRVRYSDGFYGQLRFNFMYLSSEARWYPITLAVGSSAIEQWPFPFY